MENQEKIEEQVEENQTGLTQDIGDLELGDSSKQQSLALKLKRPMLEDSSSSDNTRKKRKSEIFEQDKVPKEDLEEEKKEKNNGIESDENKENEEKPMESVVSQNDSQLIDANSEVVENIEKNDEINLKIEEKIENNKENKKPPTEESNDVCEENRVSENDSSTIRKEVSENVDEKNNIDKMENGNEKIIKETTSEKPEIKDNSEKQDTVINKGNSNADNEKEKDSMVNKGNSNADNEKEVQVIIEKSINALKDTDNSNSLEQQPENIKELECENNERENDMKIKKILMVENESENIKTKSLKEEIGEKKNNDQNLNIIRPKQNDQVTVEKTQGQIFDEIVDSIDVDSKEKNLKQDTTDKSNIQKKQQEISPDEEKSTEKNEEKNESILNKENEKSELKNSFELKNNVTQEKEQNIKESLKANDEKSKATEANEEMKDADVQNVNKKEDLFDKEKSNKNILTEYSAVALNLEKNQLIEKTEQKDPIECKSILDSNVNNNDEKMEVEENEIPVSEEKVIFQTHLIGKVPEFEAISSDEPQDENSAAAVQNGHTENVKKQTFNVAGNQEDSSDDEEMQDVSVDSDQKSGKSEENQMKILEVSKNEDNLGTNFSIPGKDKEQKVKIDTEGDFSERKYFEQIKFFELSRNSWGSTQNSQKYTRGVLWSPDGTCALTAINLDGMQIFELSSDLYTKTKVSPNRSINLLTPAVHVKEGGTVYDMVWYPFMNSTVPESCCWLASRQHEPILMWDAFTGELRCTYRGYDAYDEVEPAISVQFSTDGQLVIGGYKKSIKIFHTNVPGRDYTEIKTKKAISCMALSGTHPNTLVCGSWKSTIHLYDIRSRDFGCLAILKSHQGGITNLKYSKCGEKLYSGARKDGKIYEWDLRNFDEPVRKFSRNVTTNQKINFNLSPSGDFLGSGDTNGLVRIWDLKGDLDEIKLPLYKDCTNGFDFHPSLPIVGTSSGQYHFIDRYDDKNMETEKNKKVVEIEYENCLNFWWYGECDNDVENV